MKQALSQPNVVFGILFAAAAMLFFTIMNAGAKLFIVNHTAIEAGFYRNALGLIPFVLIYLASPREKKQTYKVHNVRMQLARGIMGVFSLFITFAAFSTMPMANVTCFLFVSSLLSPVLGAIFLKEHVGIWRWSAVAMGFMGVLIMVQPTPDITKIGIILSLTAATCHAIMGTLLRSMGKRENPFTTTLIFMALGSLLLVPLMPFVMTTPSIPEVKLILLFAISGTLGQFCLSNAYKHAPVAVVAPIGYTALIWAVFVDVIVWKDWPSPTILMGGAIIIASGLLIFYRERKLSKAERPPQV